MCKTYKCVENHKKKQKLTTVLYLLPYTVETFDRKEGGSGPLPESAPGFCFKSWGVYFVVQGFCYYLYMYGYFNYFIFYLWWTHMVTRRHQGSIRAWGLEPSSSK